MNTRDRYLRAVYLIQVATNEPAGTSAIAERLDMIIDRRPECPDCFDAEADQCALPGAEADD